MIDQTCISSLAAPVCTPREYPVFPLNGGDAFHLIQLLGKIANTEPNREAGDRIRALRQNQKCGHGPDILLFEIRENRGGGLMPTISFVYDSQYADGIQEDARDIQG